MNCEDSKTKQNQTQKKYELLIQAKGKQESQDLTPPTHTHSNVLSIPLENDCNMKL